MPMRLILWYTADGMAVKRPEGYPEELLFEEEHSADNITKEAVLASVEAGIFVTGADPQNVEVHWGAINENVH